jgi:hypothetical protein
MFKYLSGEHVGYGWPSVGLRWCTNEKINLIKAHCRQYRPYNQFIGYAFDEIKRAIKGDRNKRSQWFYKNRYPLIEYKIKEKKHYKR